MKRSRVWFVALVAAFFILAPVVASGADTWSDPYPGVRYLYRTMSGPNHVHALFIDLCEAGIQSVGTDSGDRGMRTSTFASSYGAQVAINANFYNTSNYAPVGLVVGDGVRWSDSGDSASLGVVAFDERNRVTFSPPAEIVSADAEWLTAVSGMPLLVDNGAAVSIACTSHYCTPNPRTAIGIDAAGEQAILVVVDGRSSSSVGMTCAQLADVMVNLGAHRAINLDGGGSSTMYVQGLGGVVNDYSDATERAVSNHLGFRAGGNTDYAHCCNPEPVANPSTTFVDIEAGSWKEPIAEALADAGITNGCSANPPMFCPDCYVTRLQAAIFLARAMGLTPLNPSTPTFGDVDSSSFGYGEVEALAAAGVFNGCEANPPMFCPDDEMSRAVGAVAVMRAVGLPELNPSSPTFGDVDSSDWYFGSVEAIADACIVSGCSTSPAMYCPDVPLTRVEIGSMIVRGFELGGFTNCISTPPVEEDVADTYTPPDTSPTDTYVPPDTTADTYVPADGYLPPDLVDVSDTGAHDQTADATDTNLGELGDAPVVHPGDGSSAEGVEPDVALVEPNYETFGGGCCHIGTSRRAPIGAVSLALLGLVVLGVRRRM